MATTTAPTFSIAYDPFTRLLDRFHLSHADHSPRITALVAIAWLPMTLFALVRALFGFGFPPHFFDLSIHVRLLVAIPLFLAAEHLIARHTNRAVEACYTGGFVNPEVLDVIVERARRLRDARGVELGFVVLVVGGGHVLLWSHIALTGIFGAITEASPLMPARLWYVTIGWPLALFLFLRTLWHWSIWTYMLVHLSRLPLATIATHPDEAAGIGFVSRPVSGFASFVLATTVTLASAWATDILDGRATFHAFIPTFIAVSVVALALTCGPLLCFMPLLYKARFRELAAYDDLATDYMRAFNRKWVTDRVPTGESLLGSQDLQAMNDLGGAYDRLVKTRFVPFGLRDIIGVVAACVVPMLPLATTAVPLNELLTRVAHALLGGLMG